MQVSERINIREDKLFTQEKDSEKPVSQNKTDNLVTEQEESYVPSDEGMLELYLKQLEKQRTENDKPHDTQDDEIKALKIAQNIMRGMKVPDKDESFLLKNNFKLYMAAKNIASMKERKGTAKSVLSGNEDISSEASTGVKAGDLFETGQYAGGIYCSTTNQNNQKKHKRLYYNFKDVSAQIINAHTSFNARQVLTRAKQKTSTLRRKLKNGEYDEEVVKMAITHAEAMERVAKKKIKHLQEEEKAEHMGGFSMGDTEQGDIEEQKKQDVQDMEDWFAAEMQGIFDSEQKSVDDFNQSMQELMEEFSDMMQKTIEEFDDMDELADELLDADEGTIAPEDLKKKKSKHRLEEQRAIAVADSKYLKAFFEKLQRDQQAVRTGAVRNTGAVDSGGGVISSTGGAALEVSAMTSQTAYNTAVSEVDTAGMVGAVVDVSIGSTD